MSDPALSLPVFRRVDARDIGQRHPQRKGYAQRALQPMHDRMTDTTQPSIADLVAQARAANARGDFEAARAACDKVFAQDPGNLGGLQAYAVATKFTADDPHLSTLQGALHHPQLPADVRSQVGFILGKAMSDIGDVSEAFKAFEIGNSLKEKLTYDPKKIRGQAQRIMRMSQAHVRTIAKGPKPVFILGLPRSGTSLVASALGAHPDITNLGERTALGQAVQRSGHFALPLGLIHDPKMTVLLRQAYLKDLPALGQAQVFVDKMPENYWFAGLIPQLFPGALVIHMQRPRLANLWSLWRNDFGAGHHYSYRLPWLVNHYETYLRLTDHWRKTMTEAWVDLSLEDVAQDPKGALAPLLKRLDLSWDNACLLSQTTDQEIHTVSKWQVRQGISSAIAEDWKRFEPLITTHWAEQLNAVPSDPG